MRLKKQKINEKYFYITHKLLKGNRALIFGSVSLSEEADTIICEMEQSMGLLFKTTKIPISN